VRPIGSRIRLIVAVVLVALVLTAILATQHFLLSPFSSVSISGIKANCTGIIEDSTKNPVSVGSGTILFGCNSRTGWPPTGLACSGGCPSAYPVFNVSQTGDYTPIFNLPHYYTSLFVAGTDGCSPPAGSELPMSQLTSGTRMQLSASGSSPSFYYYCASYANVGSSGGALISFTISWRSGSTLFTQTFPSVRVPPQPPPSGFGGCTSASLDSVTPATPVNGVLEFDCVDSVGPYSAFAVSVAGYYTPTFTLSQYYAGLSITPIADFVSNCTTLASDTTPPTPLTNGTQVYLAANPSYYYCANYASTPVLGASLASFTVSWSSGSNILLSQTIPSVTVPAKTTAVAVVRGTDKGLYYSSLAGSWSGWKSLGGSTAGQAVFCSGGVGTAYLAVRGSDNVSIYLRSYSNGVWSPMSPVGTASDVPACALMNGILYLVARGLDYNLYYNSLDVATNLWSGWTSLNGTLLSPPALATTPSLNRLDVVVQGGSGTIYHRALINGIWQAWDAPAGGNTADIPAVSTDGRSLQVVVMGGDNGVYYNSLNFSSGQWFPSWVSLDGTTGLAPSLATDSSGTVHLFVVGAYGRIYDKSLAGGVWSTKWDDTGGNTNNPVAVITQGSNVAIMASGTSGGVWYDTLVGSVWQGWTSLGGSTSLAPALSTVS